MKKLVYCLFAGLIALPVQLCASDADDVVSGGNSDTNQIASFPEITITATRIATPQENSPDSVTVITREQIAQSQQHLVADILRGQPGVEVATPGQPGSQTSVFLRGANSDSTLVLVDGIRVNSAFDGGYDFSQLAVDNVERIEILRGPQSTLYGSQAMGGVINIVTKRGSGPPSGWVETEAGSFNTFLTHGGFSASEGKLSVTGDASFKSSDNDRINSDYQQYHFDGHARYDFNDRFSATLLANYFHNNDGSPGSIFSPDPTARLKTENALFGLTLNGELAAWWDTKLTLSHSHEHDAYNDPFDFYDSGTIARRNQVDFQNVFKPSDQHKIMVGGTWEDAAADFSDNYADTLANTIVTRSAYGQYDFMPVERVTLTAGGRVDDSTAFGTHGTYRFGGRFTAPCTETIFRASAGTAFRAPSISDLYFPYYGNPNLKPEKSFGWDAGFEQPLLENKLRFGSTFFYNKFENLIQSDVNYVEQNIGHARTYGLENFIAWQVLTNLTARGSYTWLNTEDLDTGGELLRRPEHSGSLNLDWQIIPQLNANATALFVGHCADVGSTFVSSYTKLNLALRWQVQKHFQIFARAENLTDEHYQEAYGYPALGRGFYGGLRAQF